MLFNLFVVGFKGYNKSSECMFGVSITVSRRRVEQHATVHSVHKKNMDRCCHGAGSRLLNSFHCHPFLTLGFTNDKMVYSCKGLMKKKNKAKKCVLERNKPFWTLDKGMWYRSKSVHKHREGPIEVSWKKKKKESRQKQKHDSWHNELKDRQETGRLRITTALWGQQT